MFFDMKYRRLGKTGLRVSVIGVGTWQFGGEWGKNFSPQEVDAMLGRAKELGINLIDTAECYGDHLSEELVGHVTARNRGDWIIATKFGHKYHGYMNRTEPRTADDVLKQLEDSLRALQSDYIDLYQYHSWGDADFRRADVLEMLRKQKQAGKIRHIGNSVSGEYLRQIEQSPNHDVEAIQIIYNRLTRKPEERAFELCRRMDLGVLARVPLASGFLSGKYKPGAQFKEGDVRHDQKRQELDAKLREVEQIQKTEVPPGVNMAQWALAWCLKNPAVTCVIPGCKDIAQVESNAAAAERVSE